MKTRIVPFVAAAIAALAASGAQAQAAISQAKISSWPHMLTQPGHYKLTGNIAVPAGTSGILIAAANVTLDLNGFTIAGPVTCTGQGVCSQPALNLGGIEINGDGAVVRNGTVRGFAGRGIYAYAQSRLADLHVTQNAGLGIETGHGKAVLGERVMATRNGDSGVYCAYATFRDSVFSMNGFAGVKSSTGCTIDESTIEENKSFGVKVDGYTFLRGTRISFNPVGRSGAVYSGGGNLDVTTPF
jgi:hypothetical protein